MFVSSVYSDASMPSVCVAFAKRNGAALLKGGLRHNFLLHLLNLWDNALIDTHVMSVCMDLVDSAHKA
jgi:hypothetical protein